MDILSHSGGSQDGGSSNGNDLRRDAEASFNFASPVATPTSASQGPSTSSEPGGARTPNPNEEIFFGDFLSLWPIQLRTLSSLESRNYLMSWRMNNDNGNNADINWIAWVARSAMISNETDQVIVDKIMINPNISAANSERGFMSDDSNGQRGVTIHYTEWLSMLQSGKDTAQMPDGIVPAGGHRLASETDFMRLQISWTKRSTHENQISNSGVFFVKPPVTSSYDPSWGKNVTGYDENVGTSVGLATSMTRTSSMPTSSGTSDSNGEATHAAVSNGRGLSTGIIAGIAIGSAIAVILVAGLVWFFVRRRRNQREPQFDPQHKTTPFTEDKALAAAQAVDSHRSGRSEDSGRQDYTTHNTTNGPVAIAYGGQDQPSHTHTGSFTNLHDTGIPNGPSNYPGHNPEPIAIAVTCDVQEHQHGADTDSGREDPTHPHITLPIPPRIRHLVEPHHTDDDLRRLLAEEDHLDEEIARGS